MKIDLNKRTAQAMALSLAFILLLGAAFVVNPKEEVVLAEVAQARTAGVIATVSQMEVSAEHKATETVAASNVDVVSATAEEELEEEPEYSEWDDKLMAQVDDYLSIRGDASNEAEVVGKLRAGDVADILSEDILDGWIEISSGNATGYVSADYCVTGIDAYAYALEVCNTYATTNTPGLRIRSEASQDAKVLKTVAEGTKLSVNTDEEVIDGWVAVSGEGVEGYVSAEYVEVDMKTGTAITIEEEQAAKKAAEEAAAAAKKAAEEKAAKNQALINSANDVTLLAAIIQVEAGNECYEGQVAVGAVVMNRLRTGRYGGSVGAVIYQRGQFSTGRMAGILASGPKASCLQAAQAAINGSDYTGGALHFRRNNGAIPGVVIGNHVFY